MEKDSTEVISFVESIAKEVLAKYRRLDTILKHAPSKGNYHESILRDVINKYLPNTFSVGEGFVVNMKNEVSSQIDLLVVDNLDPRSFIFKENNFYIASNIAVCSFGEVKTSCKRKEFVDSFHKLIETSLILGGDNAASATSFIFCFDAYASPETFATWADFAIRKYNKIKLTNTWNYPDYIFCLKKNVFLERKPITGGGFHYVSAMLRKKVNSNLVQQLIIENIYRCVTDGCGRIRFRQGITDLQKDS